MKTTMSSKGQVVLPADIRELDGLLPGQQFEVERIQPGEYVLRKTALTPDALLNWLFSCPEKDWFQPIPSESTDSI